MRPMEPILSNSANPQRRSAPCLQKESENRARSETSLPSEELFLASGMARLPVSKSYRGWVLGIAAILFLGVAAAFAYYVVFSRSMSPDEGYLMITVQSFVDGNALYDKVITHYGPFYYA